AGADWILADALGVEPIDPQAWNIAQGRLRELVSDPAGVPARNPAAIGRLVEGLMLGGFAMQASKSSRAASGAEHQFSHLWDMQHHQHNGQTPSHGFKVGIGTLAVTALYDQLLKQPLNKLDIERCCAAWPNREQWVAEARELFGESEVAAVAIQEIQIKAGDPDSLRQQLLRLRSIWPQLGERLHQQLLPFATLRGMLLAAGAPVEPEQIGISRQRLRASFRRAFFVRRRFTVLDLAVRTGLLDSCVDVIFGPRGHWPVEPETKP
ncbi:MAG TPA: iron-containing alcohol dehydrogenase, partial [Verrucomicrobiae bacterium]|nr:iron-containing alcohol dehydrogenase [Verrucomicrobiae bacterium]